MKVLLIGSVPEIDEVLSRHCADIDLVVTASKRSRCTGLPHYKAIFSIDDETSDAQMMDFVLKLHSTHHYSHILTFTDKWQQATYDITRSLGMWCAVEPVPVSICQDKHKFREVMQGAGLSSVWHSEAQLTRASLEPYELPYVIKPRTGQGSVGVKIIRSESDLKDGLAQLKSIGCNEVLIEGYVDGPEFSVEAFSLDGEHSIVAITEKYKFKNSVVESGHSIPANLSADVESEIATYVVNILNTLGLRNGPSHTEVIYTVRGPVVIEGHCRIGGDKIAVLIRHATGVDYCELVVDNALQRRITRSRLQKTKSHFAAVRFIAIEDEPEGVLKSVSGARDVMKCEHVVEMKVIKSAGDKIRKVACSGDRVAYVMFSSTRLIASDIEEVLDKLAISLQSEK